MRDRAVVAQPITSLRRSNLPHYEIEYRNLKISLATL